MKAFLSYSHSDSELVQAVAARVGRPFVSLDLTSFATGDELLGAMEQAVQESSVFVFFASRESMSSAWVQFELNEARYYQAVSRIRRVVVAILDDRVAVADLPEWMRRHKFITSHAAGPIARVIRQNIDDLVGESQHRYFVGRGSEIAALQAALVPIDATRSPSVVIVRGLPGVGRRTLLSRVARDTLSYERVIAVRVENGDTLSTLTIKLADVVESIASATESLATARAIASLGSDEAQERFLVDLGSANALNELVVLYDDGGLLDRDGKLSAEVAMLLSEVIRRKSLTIALITNRRPFLRDSEALDEVPIVDVSPLSASESKQLLALLAHSSRLEISASQLTALAGQVRGYPPAALAAIRAAETYGVALVVGTTGPDYQPRPLTRYLKGLKLSNDQRHVLRVLAGNSPLPIEVIATLGDAGRYAKALADLIDASLIIPESASSWYRISGPIVDYIQRDLPACSVDDYEHVARALDRFLETDTDSGSYLDLSRVLYRALVHAGGTLLPRAYALVADWIRLAEDFYHQRDYQRALDQALAADASRRTAETLNWVIKCHIKLGSNDLALVAIDELRMLGDVREAHFLRAFLERHRGRNQEAIRHYELARGAGRGGLALERDLADCYFQVGDYESASVHIEAAQSRQSDNPFVVDLRIKIACMQRDETTARGLLVLLEAVDDPAFAAHRRARVELAFGNPEAAYPAALQAVGDLRRPPFETLTTLAVCEMRTGRDASATVGRLQGLYPYQRGDVQTGLKARLAITKKEFEEALGYLAALESPDLPVHQVLRRDALAGLLQHKFVPSERKSEIEAEIARLESGLDARGQQIEWDIAPD